jgi:putative sigma-54 modulation protein
VQIQISTRHGHVSDETQEKIRSKVERLSRYFERLTAIEVTVDLEHRETPTVDLKVSAEHKHDFVASSCIGELMASLDVVVEKMEQQLRKYKEKVQDRHRNTGGRQQALPADLGPEQA